MISEKFELTEGTWDHYTWSMNVWKECGQLTDVLCAPVGLPPSPSTLHSSTAGLLDKQIYPGVPQGR